MGNIYFQEKVIEPVVKKYFQDIERIKITFRIVLYSVYKILKACKDKEMFSHYVPSTLEEKGFMIYNLHFIGCVFSGT